MENKKWFDRKFDGLASTIPFPSIVERLRGTPARLEEKFKIIPNAFHKMKVDDTWSIKENAGHLIDLEALWQTRLEDILNGHPSMCPADLNNKKTHEANHNARDAKELFSTFRTSRKITILALEKVKNEELVLTSLHPRLKIPMTIPDLFLFVAEHDDHHLARITEIASVLTAHAGR